MRAASTMTAYVVSGIGQGARFAKLSWPHQYMLNQGKAYLQKALEEHPKMRPELRAAVVFALAESVEKSLAPRLIKYGRVARICSRKRWP